MRGHVRSFFTGRSKRVLKDFEAVYGALLIISLHLALIGHLNSSYLLGFTSSTVVSLAFMGGSALGIVLFLILPKILRRIGNFWLVVICTLIEAAAIFGMVLSSSLLPALFFFLLHIIAIPLIFFSLDIFMETMIGSSEGNTGSKRGLFLSILSIAGALGPLLSGQLIGADSSLLAPAYVVSGIFLIPFLFILFVYFKRFKDPVYKTISINHGLRSFLRHKDIRNVCFAHFHLHFFFTWMVIYTPIYLATVIGFDWIEIGLILSVAMLAYVIFEYPVGIIADKWIGEKEMMAFGFLVMGVSTSWFAFLTEAPLLAWMIAMFITRVGASFVEATTESYFFKHTSGEDADMISIFRMIRPLAAVTGAIVGSIALLLMPFNLLFIILGLLMIPGLFFTMALRDTK